MYLQSLPSYHEPNQYDHGIPIGPAGPVQFLKHCLQMRNGGLLGKSRVDYGVKKYGQHLSGNHKKDIDSSISNKKEGGKSYLLHQQCINETSI